MICHKHITVKNTPILVLCLLQITHESFIVRFCEKNPFPIIPACCNMLSEVVSLSEEIMISDAKKKNSGVQHLRSGDIADNPHIKGLRLLWLTSFNSHIFRQRIDPFFYDCDVLFRKWITAARHLFAFHV